MYQSPFYQTSKPKRNPTPEPSSKFPNMPDSTHFALSQTPKKKKEKQTNPLATMLSYICQQEESKIMHAKTVFTERFRRVATNLYDGHLREKGPLDLAACSRFIEDQTRAYSDLQDACPDTFFPFHANKHTRTTSTSSLTIYNSQTKDHQHLGHNQRRWALRPTSWQEKSVPSSPTPTTCPQAELPVVTPACPSQKGNSSKLHNVAHRNEETLPPSNRPR